ncbi:MAG: hypothetical protein KJZ62_07635 [Fimbriimonadaceae bacterium]|nr:hypothetical protein [Fimbriimonadaceae bacterium]
MSNLEHPSLLFSMRACQMVDLARLVNLGLSTVKEFGYMSIDEAVGSRYMTPTVCRI